VESSVVPLTREELHQNLADCYVAIDTEFVSLQKVPIFKSMKVGF
jgi:hypothetical protein